MDNPIKVINQKASSLKEDDVEWIVTDLMDHFSSRIYSLSLYAYGSKNGVALSAFKEWSRETLRKGVITFLFKYEHWRLGRSIGPYLATCLKKLADNLKRESDYRKRISIPVCPGCKALGEKEFLVYEGKLLRCPTCTKASNRLEYQKNRTEREEFEYRIRKVFSLHSRKGRRCPDCERFIPESFINCLDNNKVSCPYDNCLWFGIDSELDIMSHPLGMSVNLTVSLNNPIDLSGSSISEMQDFIDANDVGPDIRLEQEEKYNKEFAVVKSVISTQKSRLSDEPMAKVIKKYLMYQAFETLLEQDPAGMVGYLIHGKSLGERPIQCMIFQKYIEIIENTLPFEIITNEGRVEVFSLLDPHLDLFLGISEYHSHVNYKGVIQNNTNEVFDGLKCKGPCFIGFLCDVKDEDDNSLLSEVDYYTFSSVKMKSTVKPNALVKVVHFRIPPHYEMHSLVNLQRSRKKIVSSIRKRLNYELH